MHDLGWTVYTTANTVYPSVRISCDLSDPVSRICNLSGIMTASEFETKKSMITSCQGLGFKITHMLVNDVQKLLNSAKIGKNLLQCWLIEKISIDGESNQLFPCLDLHCNQMIFILVTFSQLFIFKRRAMKVEYKMTIFPLILLYDCLNANRGIHSFTSSDQINNQRLSESSKHSSL